jgi:uncharacterized protein YjiS (DUF1127 family)
MEQRLQRIHVLATSQLLEGIARLLANWRTARQRARERAQLAAMSPREWKDIGLTPSDARREINKAGWLP